MRKLVTISTTALEYQPSKKRKIEKDDDTLSKPLLTFMELNKLSRTRLLFSLEIG